MFTTLYFIYIITLKLPSRLIEFPLLRHVFGMKIKLTCRVNRNALSENVIYIKNILYYNVYELLSMFSIENYFLKKKLIYLFKCLRIFDINAFLMY